MKSSGKKVLKHIVKKPECGPDTADTGGIYTLQLIESQFVRLMFRYWREQGMFIEENNARYYSA